MTLAVAKNCKMTKKSNIDDVINTSKISDMPQNFFRNRTRLDDCAYQVSSPYKVFNLIAVANMSEKNTSRSMGVYTLFGVPRKPPSTHLKMKIFNRRCLIR